MQADLAVQGHQAQWLRPVSAHYTALCGGAARPAVPGRLQRICPLYTKMGAAGGALMALQSAGAGRSCTWAARHSCATAQLEFARQLTLAQLPALAHTD